METGACWQPIEDAGCGAAWPVMRSTLSRDGVQGQSPWPCLPYSAATAPYPISALVSKNSPNAKSPHSRPLPLCL